MGKLNTKPMLQKSTIRTTESGAYLTLEPANSSEVHVWMGKEFPTSQILSHQDVREMIEVLEELHDMLEPATSKELKKKEKKEEKLSIELSFPEASVYKTPGLHAQLQISSLGDAWGEPRVVASFGGAGPREQVLNSTDAAYLSQLFAELAKKLNPET